MSIINAEFHIFNYKHKFFLEQPRAVLEKNLQLIEELLNAVERAAKARDSNFVLEALSVLNRIDPDTAMAVKKDLLADGKSKSQRHNGGHCNHVVANNFTHQQLRDQHGSW